MSVLAAWLRIVCTWLAQAVRPHERLDPNARCPACGARNGALRVAVAKLRGNGAEQKVILHTCLVCNAEFAEPPLHPDQLA